MKKYIITGIAITACVALCAAVWPRSNEAGDLPAKPEKQVVTAEIEARPEETPSILFSADTRTPEMDVVAESEPKKDDITTEEKTQNPAPSQEAQSPKPTVSSSVPYMGDVRVVNGEKRIYIDGFGWIEDEGGGSHGTMVGNPGDELTGNKVGQMGGGTTVHGKGDINKQVGVMGSGDVPVPEKHNPAPGSKTIVNGKLYLWIPGFGWIECNGGRNVGWYNVSVRAHTTENVNRAHSAIYHMPGVLLVSAVRLRKVLKLLATFLSVRIRRI